VAGVHGQHALEDERGAVRPPRFERGDAEHIVEIGAPGKLALERREQRPGLLGVAGAHQLLGLAEHREIELLGKRRPGARGERKA
jgi:hypothetical protein